MTLPPLAWIVDHPAVVEPDTDRVHCWGWRRLDTLARILPRDAVLWRVRAPTPCTSCRPDVELRLSAPRRAADANPSLLHCVGRERAERRDFRAQAPHG